MATSYQDDYIKTALRLPRDLHSKIQGSATAAGRSLNSELIERLRQSFEGVSIHGTTDEAMFKLRDEVIKALYTDFVPVKQMQEMVEAEVALRLSTTEHQSETVGRRRDAQPKQPRKRIPPPPKS